MELTGREFEAIAEHAGAAYLRYSFTKGTEQEVGFLLDVLGLDVLGLGPGTAVVDVGCGPGRHAHALAGHGIRVAGVDIAWAFLRAAGPGIWVRADGRRLPFSPARFDAAISLCQGAFGLLGGRDEGSVLDEMARVVRPGGRVAFSAASAYFVARHSSEGFDPDTAIHHEVTGVRSPEGVERPFDLWTTCFTPGELRLLASKAGIEVEGLWSVSPGDYARRPPELDYPEWLVVGRV